MPLPCFLLLFMAATLRADGQSRYEGSFPEAESIKGLQVERVDDALALGIKHAAINLNLSGLIDLDPKPDSPSWELDGQRFCFREGYLQSLDRQIKPLSDAGVLVYLILLTYQSGDERVNRVMLHPNYDHSAPNRLGAFNTVTPEGRAWLTAALSFLAERWSRPEAPHGRVVGYIVGNEVNSHWWWYNRGRATMDQIVDDYHRAVRIVYGAVRQQASWPRIYLSLEHHWNIRYPAGSGEQAFPGRPFLERFAETARAEGDFDWHLAFHPYPENLFEPRFWQDKSATHTPDTPRITFKNLEVLTAFMQRPEMRFHDQPRRIILSEQGFHSPPGEEGERIQAAAYCVAYKKVEQTPGIDAFILHRHIDHPHEGGLLLGLRRRGNDGPSPDPPKKIYRCFRDADTAQQAATFEFALPMLGIESWDQLDAAMSE